jgi:Kef-type K+ transport system membrane component KefB
MDWVFLPTGPLGWPGALSIALLSLVAALAGQAAARARVPRLVGYTLAGLAFGVLTFGLAQLGAAAIDESEADLALGIASALILFDLGQRVSWGWLKRNPTLLAQSLADAVVTFGAGFFVLHAFGLSPLASALTAAIGIATSPAVVLAVTRETRAQGQITERTLLLTALNCTYAVVLSTLMLAWVHVESRGVLDIWVLQPAYLAVGALALAAVGARLMLLTLRFAGREHAMQIVVVLAFIAIVFIAARTLQLSPLLALLTFGAFSRAFDTERRLQVAELGLPAQVALMVFFALSFATVGIADLGAALAPAVAYAIVRTATRIGAVTAFARASGLTWRKGAWLGVGLAPMSVFAALLSRELPAADPALGAQVGAVIVTAAFILQIAGALLLALALRRTGEARADT